MKIDSIDIRSFDAKQLTVDFEPPQTGVTVEMFDGALIPSESETYTPLSGLTVTVLFRGKDRDEVQKHVSDFNAELQKGVVLTLDGYSRHFKAYMTGNSLSKTITKTRYTAEFKFTGYWFSDEVSLNWQGAYEAIFEAQGNRATPCRLTITATEYIEQLKAWLKKKIRDERMLYILELIIDGSEVGLPLGFYTSQWLSNFMLQPLDHFIKEQLKAVHYIRYMDDMVVFGKNKKELHRMQQEIERFLREKFNLQMKGNWQVFRFDYTEKKTGKRKGRPLDFMGFQFYHDKTILRESIMLSCTRKVNRVAKKEKITWYDATAILSYMGYLSNTDTYDMYLQRVKPYVNVKKLKKIVSKHSKRKEREKHERMERSVRNGGRTAGGVRHNSVTDNGISETQYQESNERGCRRKENHRMAARGA